MEQRTETIVWLIAYVSMKAPEKPKRKRIANKIPPLNDGTNTPVPSANAPEKFAEDEEALFKQAENPLGDPHKAS